MGDERCDVAVVGAGIIGLAVARELQLRDARRSLCVLEREAEPARHQTGRNSGVVHAGIAYLPGSLKARLCVAGARELFEFCEQHGVAHERCGKLIVATDSGELARLDELERRGRANGVTGLRRLDADALRALEPHAAGLAALHSPATGIADFAGVAGALVRLLLGDGGALQLGCEVKRVRPGPRSILLEHSSGSLEARYAIFCAGAWADRLAVLAGADPDPRIVPFRGAYLRLRPDRRELVRSLIYPVGDPALPFLGVHFTRHIAGDVLIGPTALLAGARDAGARVRAADLLATLTWPGSWRLARRDWRAGAGEIGRALWRGRLVAAAAKLVPELSAADVEPAFAGVRAQALGRDGRLLDDFVFSATPRALHVRNAPSPGATASLAISRHIADQAERSFGL